MATVAAPPDRRASPKSSNQASVLSMQYMRCRPPSGAGTIADLMPVTESEPCTDTPLPVAPVELTNWPANCDAVEVCPKTPTDRTEEPLTPALLLEVPCTPGPAPDVPAVPATVELEMPSTPKLAPEAPFTPGPAWAVPSTPTLEPSPAVVPTIPWKPAESAEIAELFVEVTCTPKPLVLEPNTPDVVVE